MRETANQNEPKGTNKTIFQFFYLHCVGNIIIIYLLFIGNGYDFNERELL